MSLGCVYRFLMPPRSDQRANLSNEYESKRERKPNKASLLLFLLGFLSFSLFIPTTAPCLKALLRDFKRERIDCGLATSA